MPSLEDLTPDQLLEHARRLEQSNALYAPLMSDPATRPEMLKLMRVKNPSMPIPELDSRVEMEKKLAEEREAREKLALEVRDDQIRRRIADERTRVKREHDLTDADMAEVEKLMVDEKAPIPHYDAAAKVFKASRLQAVPTADSMAPPIYDMPSKDTWGKGVGNRNELNKIAMKEAFKAADEFRRGNVKAA